MADPRTKEEALDVLRGFFLDESIEEFEKRKLWNILTALRGPDNSNDFSTKEATTAVVRAHFFWKDGHIPRDFIDRGRDLFGSIIREDSTRHALKRVRDDDGGVHFRSHVLKAFDAFGLKWDESNQPVPDILF